MLINEAQVKQSCHARHVLTLIHAAQHIVHLEAKIAYTARFEPLSTIATTVTHLGIAACGLCGCRFPLVAAYDAPDKIGASQDHQSQLSCVQTSPAGAAAR